LMRDAFGVTRRCPATIVDPITFDDDGVGQVCIWTVPYLEPRLHAAEFGVEANHVGIIQYVMDQVRATITERGLEDATHIMMAHLFAAGAAGSESERNIG